MTDHEYRLKYHALWCMIRAEKFAAKYHAWKEHIKTSSLTIEQLKQVIG